MTDAVDLDRVWDSLAQIPDPELGVSITDLGLVYDVSEESGLVRIVMTTTTPLCPLGSFIEREIQRSLEGVDGVEGVTVELVHQPPWGPHLMSVAAREQLGTGPVPTPPVPRSSGFAFPRLSGRSR